MRKSLPSLLAVLLTLTLGCPGDPDTDYRAAIKKDLKEKLKFECPPGKYPHKTCPPDSAVDNCYLECKPNEVR